jgi:hypothetical protein
VIQEEGLKRSDLTGKVEGLIRGNEEKKKLVRKGEGEKMEEKRRHRKNWGVMDYWMELMSKGYETGLRRKRLREGFEGL